MGHLTSLLKLEPRRRSRPKGREIGGARYFALGADMKVNGVPGEVSGSKYEWVIK